ncbi:MAG: RimK family alpha-L-glutamate ligase [Gallionellaceae bacterium]|nr:RimK family alpha-L-glutamate ligase [Gallionellaceae bacterium]
MHSDSNSAPPLIGLVVLMRRVFAGQDLRPLAAELSVRVADNPSDANALLDLSTILQLNFNYELALQVQAEALKVQRLYSIPAAKQPAKLRLLVLMGDGALIANTPVECLLENSDIAMEMLYVSREVELPASLPEHDVLFVAIAESEENIPLLYDLKEIGSVWPRPMINLPLRIALLSRDSAYKILSDVRKVVMPISVRMLRPILEQIATQQQTLDVVLAGGGFPIIIRPMDSHAGRGLAKIEDAAALDEYLQGMHEREFYISPFVDYRSQDGQYRKYRLVLIEGVPYICHLAISSHWMIHYLNAGMAESAIKREEEAACFAAFDASFAMRHAAALQEIYQRMELDYLGIDCAETVDGELLIFEVDSNMVVHALDSVEVYPYKQPQMRKVFAAFRTMLLKAASSTA